MGSGGDHLAQVHDNALVDLLPEMSSEDLDQGDLESGDLAMHEDASQVKLHLETHIHLERVGEGGGREVVGEWGEWGDGGVGGWGKWGGGRSGRSVRSVKGGRMGERWREIDDRPIG